MNNVAIVTGGSRGIGREIVRELVDNGYRVGFLYHDNHDMANSLVKELNDGILNTIGAPCDVRDYDSVAKAISRIRSTFGECSLLVNNVGVAHMGLLMDMTASEWNTVIGTNLNSAFYCSKLVIPDMLSLGGGNIINISSVWGVYGASCEVAYSASKAGLIGFTKALALELGSANIRVNAISAGVINTDMNKALTPNDITTLVDATPLGRIGEPLDIAKMCVFLASDSASFITGQNIEVTGGFKG